MKRNWLACGSLLLLSTLPIAAASRPTLVGEGGAVVADEKLAAEVGAEILRRGGNAADAAVATVLALAVVGPEAANLGGGGFAVVRMKGEVAYLDFREIAPAKARRDLYLDANGEPILNASLVGPLASGVPGSPAGYYALHKKYGRLPWATVVAPAQRLAAEGFPLSSRTHATLESEKELLARFPESAAMWLPNEGAPPAVGTVIRLPDLAATLARYAEEGPKAITGGAVAAALVAASSKYGGILQASDLAGYEPQWRQPLRYEAYGWQLASVDLPAAGGILIAGALQMLEKVGYAAAPRFGTERAHLLAEVLRRVNADRYLLGDPKTTLATAVELLEPRWLASRLATLSRDHATPSGEVALWSEVNRQKAEGTETTHIAVVDGEGQAVSLTTTLNGLYGCGLWVPKAGFFLNNEMDDFATAPGKPNLFGLIQGEANAVGPGKRMLSSQSPTIAWRDGGNEVIALGGRGGSRIPTATLQILLGFLVDQDSLQAAVDRPRIHHQWRPDRIFYEPDALSPESRAALLALGHQLEETPRGIAQAHAVHYFKSAGKARCEAAPDPRGGGGSGAVAVPWP